MAKLPSKFFVLFPGSDDASPRILHVTLPHDSPAFLEGLQEIEHITM